MIREGEKTMLDFASSRIANKKAHLFFFLCFLRFAKNGVISIVSPFFFFFSGQNKVVFLRTYRVLNKKYRYIVMSVAQHEFVVYKTSIRYEIDEKPC